MKLPRLLLVLFLIPFAECEAQTPADSSTAAGTKLFKTGGGRSFWMGANYRKEWNTPVSAPRINLATEHGGLTPVKRGGGKQTKSLRLETANGTQYYLRSIQKFITSKTLPGNLQSEAAADLVADGVSASYPYSALSVDPLAEAAGIPHGESKLVYIKEDARLGEYQADFSNMLALYEKRLPDSVKKDFDTNEVADKLKDDNDNAVDQKALLKIRILDMFVMDLDRHEDQWAWGAYDNGKGKTYYPVAKDRDQAFYTNQGVLPGIIKWPWLVPQLQGFRAKAKNINRFNFAARNLDRFFLNEMNEEDWKQATDKFVSQMTDAVIDKALDLQPQEVRYISADKIKQTLKDRRQNMAAEMLQYYRFISEIVTVTGSDKKELFEITRNDDGSLDLAVYKITKEGEQSTRMYQRKFDPQVTKEVRLYGFGGEDKFTVKGSNDKIKVRMIGGDGEDSFESTVSGGNGGFVYDTKSDNNKVTGNFRDKRSNDTIVNKFERISYKYNQVIPFVAVGFNQDDGVFIGPSIKIIRHGFRKMPYKNMNEFSLKYAFSTQAFNIRWYAEYIGTFGRNSDLLMDVDIKAPNNTTNFFGYGASSDYVKTSPGKFRFYRARYSLSDVGLALRKNFSPKVIATIGPVAQFYSYDEDDKFNAARFISMTGLNGLDPNTLFEKQTYIGGKFTFLVDTRDNKLMTRKGINWYTSLRHLEGQNDASYSVTQLNSDFTFYINIVPKKLMIANRVGGGHNFGDFEFYQAQYLGSEDNLRGYRKYRFAGRSKFYNNTEIRWALATFKTYLFPGSLGILGFYDTGRLWDDTDPTDKWLSGYGGGFWFSPLNRIAMTFTYTTSKEDQLLLVSLGWKF
jgi:hypothetical protein